MKALWFTVAVALASCSSSAPPTAEDARDVLVALDGVCLVMPPDAPQEVTAVCAALRAARVPEARPAPAYGGAQGMGGSMPVAAGNGGSS